MIREQGFQKKKPDAYDPNELQEITSFDTVSIHFLLTNLFTGSNILDDVPAHASTNCYALRKQFAYFLKRNQTSLGRSLIERWSQVPIENAKVTYIQILGRFAFSHDWRTITRKFGCWSCHELEATVRQNCSMDKRL